MLPVDRAADEGHTASMKSIDGKSLLIGALLSAVLFLSLGFARDSVVKVRIIGIDKGSFESWDAIKVSN